MTRAGLTEKLLDIKREKGWTWEYICEQIGGMSSILVTGAILGQHKLTKPQAAAAANVRAEKGGKNFTKCRCAAPATPYAADRSVALPLLRDSF